ncbi:MAG: hypothetical protein WED07_04325 [Candidatus Freyarchaeum deiterrae]
MSERTTGILVSGILALLTSFGTIVIGLIVLLAASATQQVYSSILLDYLSLVASGLPPAFIASYSMIFLIELATTPVISPIWGYLIIIGAFVSLVTSAMLIAGKGMKVAAILLLIAGIVIVLSTLIFSLSSGGGGYSAVGGIILALPGIAIVVFAFIALMSGALS